MKRTIKFKAKRLDNNEWVKGDLLHDGFMTSICFNDKNGMLITEEVDPSTICQFTGLRDKNGKEIWEHDIVKDGSLTMVVEFELGMFTASGYLLCTLIENISVIGNEFDRKEEKCQH